MERFICIGNNRKYSHTSKRTVIIIKNTLDESINISYKRHPICLLQGYVLQQPPKLHYRYPLLQEKKGGGFWFSPMLNSKICYWPILANGPCFKNQQAGPCIILVTGLLPCHGVGHFLPKLISLVHCFIDEKKKLSASTIVTSRFFP